ncbi:glutathione S-transferase family protein [Pseudohaliea sp.]|uniref:glutathione S-transferase family protein n=1 Tax=Pseudohaliea sp. TaxID=2740289 RepID=UPI0032ECED54
MSDNTFFLHHYEASPYAEKIRAMFGLARQAWGSVLTSPYPPRPDVDPLAGGYRRIPVAQVGADVFCDTALIATEVAALTGRAELAPTIADPGAQALAGRAEGDVFFAAITSAPPLKLLGKLLSSAGPLGTLRFIRDRTGMMKGASTQPPRGAEAGRLFDAYLADLDVHLADRDWLGGDQPGYADFCAYHPIWLAQSVGGAGTLGRYAAVGTWLDRMASLGHGERREMTPEQAFAEAAESNPRALPDDPGAHEAMGSEVTIAPDDYARIGVTGTLVAATGERYILARESERLGTLHVHFPREGYELG